MSVPREDLGMEIPAYKIKANKNYWCSEPLMSCADADHPQRIHMLRVEVVKSFYCVRFWFLKFHHKKSDIQDFKVYMYRLLELEEI